MTPCSIISSPLKFKSGLRVPETPSHLYMEFNNPKDDFIQPKIMKRKLSNSIIQQLNQVNNISNEIKLHKEAAGADMVRIKTERHLIKSANLQPTIKPEQIVDSPDQKCDQETPAKPVEITVTNLIEETPKITEPKKPVDKKISQQTLVSRNQRNGTLHVKFDQQFFEILKESNLEDNTFHTQNSEQVLFENAKENILDPE